MSNNKLSRTNVTKEYDGFTGIDISKTLSGEGGIKSLTDFRLRFDGALEKRSGFELFTTFTGNVRAVYQFSSSTLLLLVNRTVYLLYLSTGGAKPLNDIGTSSGEATFFSYNGNIYLIDGNEIYVMRDEYFFSANGYIPLYGKEWHPLTGGEVNEPLNILTQKIRISFVIPGTGTYNFKLPLFTQRIEYATLNGKPEEVTNYSLSSDNMMVYSQTSYEYGDIVELFLTISNIYVDPTLITRCHSAAVYGDGSAGADKVFIAFYNGSNKNIIFPTSSVSDEQLKICNDAFRGVISNIYVKGDSAISANDGKGNIVDVCQKDKGLMVFTDDRAFMLTSDETGKNHFVRVSLGTGCSSPRGAIISDDTPITVSYYGIYKWDPSSYEEGEYRARCISRPVGELLDDGFFSTAIAYHYRKKGELWFCNPSDPRGTVLIYSIDAEAWYVFTGIGAEFFFEYNGELGFIKGNKAYIFSGDKVSDSVDGSENEVNARFESGIISFGGFWEKKRLARCIIRTSPGATVKLTITDAEGREEIFELSDGSDERIGFIDKRLTLHRSRHYSFSVETSQSATIYGITLVAVD